MELPPEVWVNVLCYLNDFQSLYRFGRTCKAQNALIDEFSSILHFRISQNLGYGALHTSGSAETVYPGSSNDSLPEQSHADARHSALAQAIRHQNTMIKSGFDQVQNWEDFAILKTSINKQWRRGIGKLSSAINTVHPDRPIWRWKFDPQYEFWAMTSPRGGLRVFSSKNAPTGRYKRWEFGDPLPHSHLEFSGPYLVTSNPRDQFLVCKRQDSAFNRVVSSDDLDSTFEEDVWDNRNIRIGRAVSNCEPLFKLCWVLDMPLPALAFKVRAPFLAAASSAGAYVHVWDLISGEIVERYDVSPRGWIEMCYIELDANYIFLAGPEQIDVYNRESRRIICHIGIGSSFWGGPVQLPKFWTAIHRDVRGGHLVALSRNGWLIWTPKYRQLVEEDNRQDFVAMDLGVDGATGLNLCVENGRAVFSMSTLFVGHAPIETVFLLNLRKWSDDEPFVQNPPQLISILKTVPSFTLSSRLEMDSCAVYLTSVGVNLEASSELSSIWQKLQRGPMDRFKFWNQPWLNQFGQVICEHHVHDPHARDDLDGEAMKEWLVALNEWNERYNDWADSALDRPENIISSILKYSFADPSVLTKMPRTT